MIDTRAIARIKAEAAALNRLALQSHELVAGSVVDATATCSCGEVFTGERFPDAVLTHVEHARLFTNG